MAFNAPDITAFLHERSSTISYLVADPATGKAAVIDPAVDFDLLTGRLDSTPADAIAAAAESRGLMVEWILETHVHADHVTGAQHLRQRLGGRVAISKRITEVQTAFAPVYGEDERFCRDGSQFDHLFEPDALFSIGRIEARAIPTPGHTPACMSYLIGDAVFVGDSIFMPDFGTARCDFPGGDAAELYQSARRILSLPDATRVFVGHDYGPGGRPISWESSVGEQKRSNKHVGDGIVPERFIEMRKARDAQLGLPAMIIPAIQINMRAGKLPEPGANGISHIKVPVNGFPGVV
ncbi:MAG: MBL fold metallo-hydrolase [Proteobacteria bacterium]|nr:MBL fold metallo-hydrolase [Pseudomonadota bacterium]